MVTSYCDLSSRAAVGVMVSSSGSRRQTGPCSGAGLHAGRVPTILCADVPGRRTGSDRAPQLSSAPDKPGRQRTRRVTHVRRRQRAKCRQEAAPAQLSPPELQRTPWCGGVTAKSRVGCGSCRWTCGTLRRYGSHLWRYTRSVWTSSRPSARSASWTSA